MDGQGSDRLVTVPNAISVARLVAVPVFGWLVLTEHDVAAVVLLAVSAASDWIDGVIARRFDQSSAIGAVLDPAADRAFIIVTVLTMAWRELIPWWLLALVLAREAVMAVVLWLLRRRRRVLLAVEFVGKAATLGLMYALPLLLFASLGGWPGRAAWIVGWAFAIWGVGLYWVACLMYVRRARVVLAGVEALDGAP